MEQSRGSQNSTLLVGGLFCARSKVVANFYKGPSDEGLTRLGRSPQKLTLTLASGLLFLLE